MPKSSKGQDKGIEKPPELIQGNGYKLWLSMANYSFKQRTE